MYGKRPFFLPQSLMTMTEEILREKYENSGRREDTLSGESKQRENVQTDQSVSVSCSARLHHGSIF